MDVERADKPPSTFLPGGDAPLSVSLDQEEQHQEED